MTEVVSVLTTKDGQGSSTFALALAWALAAESRVMLVDADMAGTGTLADQLALDFDTRGIGNLFGTLAVSAFALEQQAITVSGRPRLRVVPGLQGLSGPGVRELLPRLAEALRALPDDVAVLDLGAALAYPGQESPRQAAETICSVSTRVFVVVQDSPARLVKSIQVLRAAQLPQLELIVMETRRGALRRPIEAALAEHLPGAHVRLTLAWDARLAVRAEDAAVPMVHAGLAAALDLAPVRAAGVG